MTGAAFYCVSNGAYFPGAVAMINSLRFHGHRERIYVLDAGLSADQRLLLAREAEIVPMLGAAHPHLAKTVAPLAHPADVQILIDVDMVLTRSLDDVIERARAGALVAFENSEDRWIAQWGELLGIGPTPRSTYVSSGLVALGGPAGPDVLMLMEQLGQRVDYRQTLWRDNIADYPFLYADQDVLNAILCARLAPAEVIVLPARLAPVQPFADLTVDLERLTCMYADGTQPYVLHHILPRKPWPDGAHESPYTRLLREMLNRSDLPLRPSTCELPLSLRRGHRAKLEQRRINLREQLRWRIGR